MFYLCGENKGVISFAVTTKLICIFVFAYAKFCFSHDVAHISCRLLLEAPQQQRASKVYHYSISRVVRKRAFCICENKDADQLRGNREADQRLCFRHFVFATWIVQFLFYLNPKFQASSHLLWLYSPVCVGNPEDRFSHNKACMFYVELTKIIHHSSLNTHLSYATKFGRKWNDKNTLECITVMCKTIKHLQ